MAATTTASSNGHRGASSQTGDLLVPARYRARTAGASEAFSEIGTTGLRQYGGFVLEEWLQALAGRRGAWVWREMLDNDPTVGAIMFAIRWLARGVEWRVEEGSQPEAAEFVEQCMHDMSHTWGDFVSEALSMLAYGYAPHEIVYKRRNGPQPDSARPVASTVGSDADTSEDDANPASSQYSDGKIGWRKLPVRAQETLLRWHFDGYSGIEAFEQVDWHDGDHTIPIAKLLLFRTQTTRNNPEGLSILRNAYTSYHALKNIRQIEQIGIERDLAGIPVATPPEGVDLFAAGQANLLSKVQQMVTGVRRDEYEGIVLPSAGWKFELISSAGARQIDTDAVIRRYRQDIATSMLADFVLIGQDAVGSFAMVDVKSELFGVAIDGILDLICEVLNRYAIPRLLALNGMDVSEPPEIHHASAGRIDLEKVGGFLYQLAGSGAPIPWSLELLQNLFQSAGLPANFEEQTSTTPVVPVGPEKLPPGTDPFAREAHAGTPEPQPAPGGDEKPAPAPIAKAQRETTRQGTVVHVAAHLQRRHLALSAQLEAEINAALGELAEHAATAYATHAVKASSGMVHRLVGRVMASLNLAQWVQTRLKPILANHAGRVTADTQRTLQSEIHLELKVGDAEAQAIADTAGSGLGMADIAPQVRASILQAVKAGLERGENPVKTADRIRQDVPAGRFVHAGPRYRSRLIARNETAEMMRAAALSAYQSNPHITAVRVRDGIFGAPRSDGQCVARDGQTVAIADAASVVPYHPQCTLSLDPVVTGIILPAAPTPAPVAPPVPALA